MTKGQLSTDADANNNNNNNNDTNDKWWSYRLIFGIAKWAKKYICAIKLVL